MVQSGLIADLIRLIWQLMPSKNKEIWKKYPHAFRAEYASDWDCGVESSYWYVIKDVPFDVNALKAKGGMKLQKGIVILQCAGLM